MNHHTLPPGRYYIGDPCYVFNDDTWDRLLLEADSFEHDKIILFNGQELWAHNTAWGDGTYMDQNGAEYGVDSGLLGAVPIDLVEDPAGLESGRVIDAPNGLHVEYDNGTFWLGNTVIKTEDDDEEEDPYSGDPEDDEFV